MAIDYWKRSLYFWAAILLLASLPRPLWAGDRQERTPRLKEVLIFTRHHPNDDRLLTLAGAFHGQAIVRMVAPSPEQGWARASEDRANLPRVVRTRRVFETGHLIAYEIRGCGERWMEFSLESLLRENPPDLVIAGFDDPPTGPGGPARWAERAAAIASGYGVAALAVIPPRAPSPECTVAMAHWLASLSQHPLLDELTARGYLRVDFPSSGAYQKWVVRIGAPPVAHPTPSFKPLWQEADGDWLVWTNAVMHPPEDFETENPKANGRKDYIFLTPMSLDRPDRAFIRDGWFSDTDFLTPIPAVLKP